MQNFITRGYATFGIRSVIVKKVEYCGSHELAAAMHQLCMDAWKDLHIITFFSKREKCKDGIERPRITKFIDLKKK